MALARQPRAAPVRRVVVSVSSVGSPARTPVRRPSRSTCRLLPKARTPSSSATDADGVTNKCGTRSPAERLRPLSRGPLAGPEGSSVVAAVVTSSKARKVWCSSTAWRSTSGRQDARAPVAVSAPIVPGGANAIVLTATEAGSGPAGGAPSSSTNPPVAVTAPGAAPAPAVKRQLGGHHRRGALPEHGDSPTLHRCRRGLALPDPGRARRIQEGACSSSPTRRRRRRRRNIK